MRLILAVLFGFGFLAVMFAGPAMAAPKADLWPDWQAHDAQSAEVIDHGTRALELAALINADEEQIDYIDDLLTEARLVSLRNNVVLN